MKLEANLDKLITISLSRKNLEGLLAQLNDAHGTPETPQLIRRDESGVVLVATAQENADHYGERLSGVSHASQIYGERHA